jgi:hypothetical protein
LGQFPVGSWPDFFSGEATAIGYPLRGGFAISSGQAGAQRCCAPTRAENDWELGRGQERRWRGLGFGPRVRVVLRRFSSAMDLGLISHWPLPGRPGCFCFSPESRPRLRRRQTSALVVLSSRAVCWAVSQRSCRAGICDRSFQEGYGRDDATFTLAVVSEFGNRTERKKARKKEGKEKIRKPQETEELRDDEMVGTRCDEMVATRFWRVIRLPGLRSAQALRSSGQARSACAPYFLKRSSKAWRASL